MEKIAFTTKNGLDIFMFIEKSFGKAYYASIYSAVDSGKQNRLLFASYDLNNYDEPWNIYIGDIQVGKPKTSKGYGTIFMNYIIDLAKTNNVKFIHGKLGPADLSDHEPRLLNFYRKFGFDIELEEDGKRGLIRLDL